MALRMMAFILTKALLLQIELLPHSCDIEIQLAFSVYDECAQISHYISHNPAQLQLVRSHTTNQDSYAQVLG